jgi:hypothetical protein
MSGKFQPQGGIYEPCSDIPLNWSDMQSMFEYKLLSEIASLNRRRYHNE